MEENRRQKETKKMMKRETKTMVMKMRKTGKEKVMMIAMEKSSECQVRWRELIINIIFYIDLLPTLCSSFN